jgi:hypothetical protein
MRPNRSFGSFSIDILFLHKHNMKDNKKLN